MIPNPIRKVLSSIQKHRVRALLMGGQACVFYGAAEFSRDTDFAILANAANLARLQAALEELKAKVIAVPSFTLDMLRKGHAVHFRCHHPDAAHLRVDVMTRMRGVDPFASLWRRRTTVRLPDGAQTHLMSLPDLVQAKKTQRDKDWPMIRRLVEAHFFSYRDQPTAPQIRFWLLELRTPELLRELARTHASTARKLLKRRPLLKAALKDSLDEISDALVKEEIAERKRDQLYWKPLKQELESLRHARIRGH